MRRILFFVSLLIFSLSPLFCIDAISPYTEEKIDEFMNLRVSLTAGKTTEDALSWIDDFDSKTASRLPLVAIDLEQERLILDSLYLMERYHYLFDPANPNKNRAQLRSLMKEQMKKNEKCMNALKKEGASKWLYLFTGDVTTFYMTRSMTATFRYGLRVKHLYEDALRLDPALTFANINLGNWFFYAPKLFGGSMKKALAHYEAAANGARTEGEYYSANIYLSQYWFANNKLELSESYLKKADDIIPGSKEIATIRKINKFGKSLFQYNRDQTGIDEEMDAAEKNEDDS